MSKQILLIFILFSASLYQSTETFQIPNEILEFQTNQACTILDQNKINCGYLGINQTQCQNQGCCWVPVNEPAGGSIPWCFNPTPSSCISLNFTGINPGFGESDIQTMLQNFYANLDIEGKGGVAASPDKTMNYYQAWMRDTALSMRAYMEWNQQNLSIINNYMQTYVSWILNVQNEQDPNGIDIRGEPKFFLPDGQVYNQSWCRPQNDGPALRSTTLMMYANQLINNGNSSYVSDYLWTGNGSSYNGGAIKFDLDYLAQKFIGMNTCDLWEEIQNTELFWDYMVARKALLIGSQFAQQMGDSNSASTYQSVGQQLQDAIPSTFWNGNFYQEANNRQQDGAVILAFNNGYNNDGFLQPTDAKIAATVAVFNSVFCTMFSINQKDTQNGIPGVMYGRYWGDTYQGGNPWILISAGLAELFYRGANYALTQSVQQSDMNAWSSILNIPENSSTQTFATAMANAGSSVLYRIYTHVSGNNFNLYEQIDRNTGDEVSAYGLTWSYANVLMALNQYNLYQQNSNMFLQSKLTKQQ